MKHTSSKVPEHETAMGHFQIRPYDDDDDDDYYSYAASLKSCPNIFRTQVQFLWFQTMLTEMLTDCSQQVGFELKVRTNRKVTRSVDAPSKTDVVTGPMKIWAHSAPPQSAAGKSCSAAFLTMTSYCHSAERRPDLESRHAAVYWTSQRVIRIMKCAFNV